MPAVPTSQFSLAQLRSPAHDADALVRVLGDPGIGGFDVDLLVDADGRAIRRRIAAFFANRDRDDLLLLHFSCHGIKDTRGRLHLTSRDTDLSVLGATSVPASFVHDALDETQSRRVVLILDCCYSGAFARPDELYGSFVTW
jgi:Caspase domain